MDDYSSEITYLLLNKLKYAEQIDTGEVYWITLNPIGIAALKAGGHSKYVKKIERKERNEAISNWPKRNWWAVALITLAIGAFVDIGKEVIFRKVKQDTNQSIPTTPTLVDTVQNHKMVP